MKYVTVPEDSIKEVRSVLEAVHKFLTGTVTEKCSRCHGKGYYRETQHCDGYCASYCDCTKKMDCTRCNKTGHIQRPVLGAKGMIQGPVEWLPQNISNALDLLP